MNTARRIAPPESCRQHARRGPRLLTHVGLLGMLTLTGTAEAQLRVPGVYLRQVPVADYDQETNIYVDHARVILPPTYIRVPRPDPPTPGYYAWKITFTGEDPVTLVLRTDSALTAADDQRVLRASQLYACRDTAQWLLDCTNPVRATTRRLREHIELDITEPAIIKRLRAGRPAILHRQVIEPGGRFRVDETGIKYPQG